KPGGEPEAEHDVVPPADDGRQVDVVVQGEDLLFGEPVVLPDRLREGGVPEDALQVDGRVGGDVTPPVCPAEQRLDAGDVGGPGGRRQRPGEEGDDVVFGDVVEGLVDVVVELAERSEERRVGKEGR